MIIQFSFRNEFFDAGNISHAVIADLTGEHSRVFLIEFSFPGIARTPEMLFRRTVTLIAPFQVIMQERRARQIVADRIELEIKRSPLRQKLEKTRDFIMSQQKVYKDMEERVAISADRKDAIRDALNLVSHPSNLGRKIFVKGDIITYYGIPGVKNISECVMDQ